MEKFCTEVFDLTLGVKKEILIVKKKLLSILRHSKNMSNIKIKMDLLMVLKK